MNDKLKEEIKRAMVVVAHADDAEFVCSGTVAKWCSEGVDVVYVICTDGSKGSDNPDMTSNKLSKIRREEQSKAGSILGLKCVEFLDYEDSVLQPTIELRRDIAREIRRYKPDVLVCMYPMRNLKSGNGGHPDHIASGEAALSAVFPTARDRLTFPDLLKSGLEPHKVSEVWIMGHPDPNLWIDVTPHILTAAKALSQHVSQLGGKIDDDVVRLLKNSRRRTAFGKGLNYAEAFRRLVYEERLVQIGIFESADS